MKLFDFDFYREGSAKIIILVGLQLPVSEVGTGIGRSGQVDCEDNLLSRADRAREQNLIRSAHLVAALEDQFVVLVPVAGAVVAQRPGLGEGIAGGKGGVVFHGLADEGRVQALFMTIAMVIIPTAFVAPVAVVIAIAAPIAALATVAAIVVVRFAANTLLIIGRAMIAILITRIAVVVGFWTGSFP